MGHFTFRHVQEDGNHQKVGDVQLFFSVTIVLFHFAQVPAFICFIVLMILNLERDKYLLSRYLIFFTIVLSAFSFFTIHTCVGKVLVTSDVSRRLNDLKLGSV